MHKHLQSITSVSEEVNTRYKKAHQNFLKAVNNEIKKFSSIKEEKKIKDRSEIVKKLDEQKKENDGKDHEQERAKKAKKINEIEEKIK